MKIISCKEAKALGLKKYFTGKPCCHGHVAERYTYNGHCKGCTQDYMATPEYRERTRVKARARKLARATFKNCVICGRLFRVIGSATVCSKACKKKRERKWAIDFLPKRREYQRRYHAKKLLELRALRRAIERLKNDPINLGDLL